MLAGGDIETWTRETRVQIQGETKNNSAVKVMMFVTLSFKTRICLHSEMRL